MATGRVKWFNAERGFGFINLENDKTDIFVHYSEIQDTGFRTLKDGQEVEFELYKSDRGPQAKNVKPISEVEEELDQEK